jgi:hypothetical protein
MEIFEEVLLELSLGFWALPELGRWLIPSYKPLTITTKDDYFANTTLFLRWVNNP